MVAELKLTAARRTEKGKQAAARLRAEGRVPGVVYGAGTENTKVTLDAKELGRLLQGGHSSGLIQLELDEGQKQAKPTPVLIKEVQRDPLKGSARHVDLYAVAMDHEVTTQVPVVVRGEEKRRALGGIVQHVLHRLEISALPGDLPERVEVDVATFPIGHLVHVGDLALPKGVKAVTPAEDVVVSIVAPMREVAGEEEKPAEEAAAEPQVVAKGKGDDEGKGEK
jgi:large subunit ribosomal protein L25